MKLNETTGGILRRCTGDKPVGEVIEELKTHYADGAVESGGAKSLEVSHASSSRIGFFPKS